MPSEFPLWLSGNKPDEYPEVVGPSLASLSGLRTWCCHELWCRSQTRLRSRVAVALVQASSYSSNWPLAMGAAPKRKKKKNMTHGFHILPNCSTDVKAIAGQSLIKGTVILKTFL